MNEQLMADSNIKSFVEAINSLKEMDEELFTDEVLDEIMNNINGAFTAEQIQQSINQIIQNLELQGTSKSSAEKAIAAVKEFVNELVYGDNIFSGNKRKVIDQIINKMFYIFDAAIEKYHSYAIELPIMLEDGAQEPTYAHESDAAADMYAMEDVMIPAHFKGVPIKTGVHIQLPEGWVAMLFPRSSIGAKTPLRLSNSAGIIDSGYRGEVRALYDNIGDEPYQIKKGDRIAQLMVMPSYRFKANVVDSLEDSDRGEGGFGSTGT